jgi:gluconokinase
LRGSACLHVIVMGVSGSGKSAVGTRLASEIALEFIDGDDHHPPTNIEKMAAGIPLTDEDRARWLRALADLVAQRHGKREGTVLACSALRRTYRDELRAAVPPKESFVIELDADIEILRSRLVGRRGHYMPASLLDSQLATLEPLERDEAGVVLDSTMPEPDLVAEALTAVNARHGSLPPDR